MGRSPQRAARLHFSASGISRKNANGPGPRKYWRARASTRGISIPRRRRQSFRCTCNSSSGGFAGCCTTSITFVRQFPGNSARGVTRDFACRRSFAKCIAANGTADRRCFSVTWSNGEHYSRWQQSCRTKRADSRRAMADPDSRSAAYVFCRVASCASVCPAQHQS